MDYLLPGLFAGVVAMAVPAAIERFGGKLGGLLGTLPSTIVPAAIGIRLTAADDAMFVASMAMVPAGMFLNVLFLWLWRVLPPRLPALSISARLALMVGVSLSVWIALALGVVMGGEALILRGVPAMGVGLTAAMAIVVLGVVACWRHVPAPSGSRSVALWMHLLRGLFACAAIAFAVWLSAVGGAVASGVASIFPAIFVTTMAALWLSQGEAVQAGAVGPMMLGSSSVAAFALIAAIVLPAFGNPIGAVVAWLSAVCLTSIPAWLWLRRAP
ncbi:MAG: hypothetical protein VYE15_00990 [Myxococcota bacterium]|nr:hypothetical protein [Myxococcota bacterium]